LKSSVAATTRTTSRSNGNDADEFNWEQIAPHLDKPWPKPAGKDRDAVLCAIFENNPSPKCGDSGWEQ